MLFFCDFQGKFQLEYKMLFLRGLRIFWKLVKDKVKILIMLDDFIDWNHIFLRILNYIYYRWDQILFTTLKMVLPIILWSCCFQISMRIHQIAIIELATDYCQHKFCVNSILIQRLQRILDSYLKRSTNVNILLLLLIFINLPEYLLIYLHIYICID